MYSLNYDCCIIKKIASAALPSSVILSNTTHHQPPNRRIQPHVKRHTSPHGHRCVHELVTWKTTQLAHNLIAPVHVDACQHVPKRAAHPKRCPRDQIARVRTNAFTQQHERAVTAKRSTRAHRQERHAEHVVRHQRCPWVRVTVNNVAHGVEPRGNLAGQRPPHERIHLHPIRVC